MKTIINALFLFVALTTVVGCGQSEFEGDSGTTNPSASIDQSDFVTTVTHVDAGDAQSQYDLGWRYFTENAEKAVNWWHLAAENGHAEAQWALGSMYADGLGIPQNYQEAVKWYKLSAHQGNASGLRLLGYMYREGNGVPQDFQRAYVWYSLSAAKGNTMGALERDEIRIHLSAQALEQAQAQATRCFESSFQDCD